MNLWAKTLLTSYKLLDKLCDDIDEVVLKYGLGSRNQDTFLSLNRIVQISEQKILIINTKVLIDNALKYLTPEMSSILKNRYFDDLKFRELAEIYDINIRTTFRSLHKAEDAFERKLNSMGYTDQKLSEIYKGQKWMANIYKDVETNEKEGKMYEHIL